MTNNKLNRISRVVRPKNKNKPDAGLTIFIRLQFLINNNRKIIEISTRTFCKKNQWNTTARNLKGNGEQVRRDLKIIKEYEYTIEHVWDKVRLNPLLTPELFISEIYRALKINRKGFIEPKTISHILPLFDHYIQMKSLEMGENRKMRIKLVQQRLAEFLIHQYRTENVSFNELSPVLYRSFKNYLHERYGLKLSTLEGMMKVLKSVSTQAFNDGILIRNPFPGCKSQKIIYPPRNLTMESYLKIANCDETLLTPDVIEAKKWFLILCNTGLSHVDLKHISNIEKKGEHYILRAAREKTDITFTLWIRPNVITLLNELCKLQNKPSFSELVPPSLNVFNLRLKIVAAAAGLKENLTSHMGRHTYGSQYINHGGSNFALADNLGHTDLKQTRHYGRNSDDSLIAESRRVYNNITHYASTT